MMRRREFITLLGGAAVARPLAARAQQAEPPRIAVLLGTSEQNPEGRVRYAAFVEALGKLGWTEGGNIRIETHWGSATAARSRLNAAEIVASAPRLILAQGSTNSVELQRATGTIPIIFVGASDPLGSGLVDSLAHPGGNTTGFSNYEFSIGGKWLGTLKELSPVLRRVLVIHAPDNLGNQGLFRAIESAGQPLGVQALAAPVRNRAEIDGALSTFVSGPDAGLIVLPASIPLDNADLIIDFAAKQRLPAIYPLRPWVKSGGLMSYDTDITELYRRAAAYADRILHGEKLGNLPVQEPTKFELVINLKTAKAIGIIVPPTLLARADEVIE